MLRRIKQSVLVIIAVIFALSIATPPTYAADQNCTENGFYSSNDVLYYCKDFITCGTESIKGLPVTSDNTETILRYFTAKGFSLAAASGIVGNLNAESNLNPAIIQGGRIAPSNYQLVSGVGFGLAQWTSAGRQDNLEAFASSTNRPITDLGMQLDFLWKELNDSYKKVIVSLSEVTDDPVVAAIRFHGMTSHLRGDPRIEAADPPFPGFEASADTPDMLIENRGGYATSVYEQYKGKIADGTGVSVDSNTDGTSINATGCTSPSPGIGEGKGMFTDGGRVAGADIVLANAQASEEAFGTKLVWSGLCLAIVSDVWNGQITGGKPSAITFWYAYKNIAHTDKSPKVGSVLLMKSGSPHGHIVIYLGNNKVLNDGHIDDATSIQGGSFEYLGWIDPNDIGWEPHPITDVKKSIRQDILSIAGL